MSVARGKLAAGGRYESSDLQHDTTGERHPVSFRFRNQGEAPKATTPVSLQPCGSSVPAPGRCWQCCTLCARGVGTQCRLLSASIDGVPTTDVRAFRVVHGP